LKIRKKIFFFTKKIGDKLGFNLPYFVENGFWVALSQAIQIGIGIALSVIMARFTSPELLGNYNFLISILTVFSLFALPGLNTSIMRSIAKEKHGIYSKAVRLSFLWSLLGAAGLFLLAVYFYFYRNELFFPILFAAFLFPFFYSFSKWDTIYQSQLKFNISALYNSIKLFFVALLISIICISKNDNLLFVFIVYLFSNTFLNILFHFFAKKHLKNNQIENDWKKSGYKLTLITFMVYVYDYFDKIVIGIYFDSKDLAIYSIAAALIIYLRMALKMMLRVLLPKLFKQTEFQLRLILRKFSVVFLIIMILLSIVLYFIFPYLILFLYSSKYFDSIYLAQIYLITLPATAYALFLQDFLTAFRAEDLMIKIKLVFTLLNLLLYFLLIPIYGMAGAIVASIIYYNLLALVLGYFSWKK